MASADRDSAASEDGETRFLLHEDVLTVIGSGETGNYTLVEPAGSAVKSRKDTDLLSVSFLSKIRRYFWLFYEKCRIALPSAEGVCYNVYR